MCLISLFLEGKVRPQRWHHKGGGCTFGPPGTVLLKRCRRCCCSGCWDVSDIMRTGGSRSRRRWTLRERRGAWAVYNLSWGRMVPSTFGEGSAGLLRESWGVG